MHPRVALLLAVAALCLQQPRSHADPESESASHRRASDWYRRRHPDGGLREKAVAEKLRLAPLTGGTSGQWNPIGPQPIQDFGVNYSGRVWGIAVDPRNSAIVYAGTDGGGVWKTTDGGATWQPLTDSQANLNIRDLTLAPSAPDTIFAATQGGGILKSTDDGATWTTLHPGGAFADYVSSISVHPTNANIVLAADANYNNIFRSANGGASWTQVLGPAALSWTDPPKGQVLFDPSNGSVAYAVLADGLHRSADSGATWALAGSTGLPSGPFGWINFAVAPSSSNILYLALKGTDDYLIGFYRSTNSGAGWSQINSPPNDNVNYWGWSLRVHPTNPNLIYAGSLDLSMSTDGGITWARNSNGLHVDHHVQTYSADGRLFVGSDGGIWSTATPTASHTTWTNLNSTLNTAMFYPGISISPFSLNTAFGGTQDNGVLQYQGSLPWKEVICGDGGFTAIDSTNPQNVYAACQSIELHASTDGGNTWASAQTGINTQDRVEFIPPLVMDPSSPSRLYFGTYRLYQTSNGANSWTPISQDLTNNYPYGGIAAIAVAPSDPNTVYTGAPNGIVSITRNALSGTGATWTAFTLPSSPSITQITVDPQSPLTAWVAVTGGRVYRTLNGGGNWTSLSSGLPNLTINDVQLDPDIAGTVYAATDVGVYRSTDTGQSWLPLGTAMPNVIVHSIRLDRGSRTLRAATYGRGMWDLGVPVTGQASITIASSTAGAYFSLEDGATHQSPATFFWFTGATHTVTWLSAPPGSTGTRYVFSGWTDGVPQNARTITVPSTATTYTANVTPQFLLTAIPAPSLAGIVTLTPSSTDGYYDPGASVQVNAAPASGYSFWYLSGDLNGGVPQNLLMNAPHNVTANFYCTYSYTYFPNNLGSAATAGIFQLQTGAGCSWTLTPGAPWFTITSPSSGAGPATVAYSVAANAGATRVMTLTVNAGNVTPFQPTVTQDSPSTGRPTVISMQPDSGSGSAQIFAFQFQDPNGFAKISSATMSFETAAFQNPACDVYFGISGATVNAWLSSDAGGFTLGPVAIPSATALQNSQCVLDASNSSVSGSGNLLTATVALTFKSTFSGAKIASAYALDSQAGVTSSPQMMGTWTVTTGSASSLAVAKSHTGNFSQGQSNATYNIAVSNLAGAGATSGTVTVTDTVPAGLTLVSMSGAAWTCSSNSCNRSDSLLPNSSYPPIVVTVNVAPTASSQVANLVTLAGGGSASASATDVTSVTPVPASVTATQGSGQSAQIGTAFAATLQATVKDAAGNVLPNVSVNFTAPSTGAGGVFAGGTTTVAAATNANGIATAPAFTANTTSGNYSVTATVAGIGAPAAFTLSNMVGAPGAITATQGSGQAAPVNAAFAVLLQATLKDSGGNLLPNVTVTFTAPASGASGAFAGGVKTVTTTTNPSGVASAPPFTANSIAGAYTVTATAAGVSNPANFTLTNSAAAPASIVPTQGAAQTAQVNTAYPILMQVTVKDAAGNLLPNITVTFGAPTSGPSGIFPGGSAGAGAVTNAAGVATAPAFTANSVAGIFNVTASVAGVGTAGNFSLTNTAAPAAVIAPSQGSGQSTLINTAFPIVMQATVKDASGNRVPFATVSFTAPANGPSGTFQGGAASASAVTNAAGVATAPPFSANSIAGAYGVGATTTGVATAAIFGLTNLAACVVAVSPLSPGLPATASTLTLTLNNGACGWVASSNVSWMTVAANSGTSGTLNVSVAANTSGLQRTGTLNVAGQTVTVTQSAAAASQLPALVSLSPFQGTGSAANLTLAYSDPYGWSALQSAEFIVNPRWEPNQRGGGCYIKYAPATGLFTLIGDDGLSIAGASTGAGSTISNSQCTLNSASASGSGNVLTLTVSLTFSSNFSGQRHIWMQASDYINQSTNWLVYGVWYPTQTSLTTGPWYRIYDPNSKSYLYSADANEYNYLGTQGFVQQGVSGLVMNGVGAAGGVSNIAWYRVFVTATSSHLWTSDRNEFLTLVGLQTNYVGEGVAAFVMPYINALGQVSPQVTNTIPFYRAAFQGANIHFWTSDPNEFFGTNGEHLPAGYVGEGIACYIFPATGAQFTVAPVQPAVVLRTGVVTPGQRLTLYGSNLDGKVLLNGVPAQVVETQPNQVHVLVPRHLSGAKEVTLEVTGAAPVKLTVVPADPAILGTNAFNRGNAQARNQDGIANSPGHPAARGSVVTLFTTGYTPGESIQVHIAGRPAEVLATRVSGSRPGIVEVQVRIPGSVDPAPFQPIVLRLGDLFTPPGIGLAIR